MADFWFFVGAIIFMIVLSLIVDAVRARGPYSSRSGSVIYAIWVAEALYGAGSREDWRLWEAASYILAGMILWVIADRADKGRRSAAS